MKKALCLILHFCTLVHGDDSIDGTLLSNELKKIKEDIGINHFQTLYNNFPYVDKTDTGSSLLSNIQKSLDVSLSDLNLVLNKIKSTKQSNPDSSTTTLPLCCQKLGTYKYDPKFRKEVDLSTACITKPPVQGPHFKYPPEAISATMKTNYETNKNVLWQHYSTSKGASIIYPSVYWERCESYDPRFTSTYASASYKKNKDVVIVLDISSSMKQPSGVTDKTKMAIAREAANNVIQTLKPDDRIGIVRFNGEVSTPSSCYQSNIAFATKVNTDKMKEFVLSTTASSSPDSDFGKALETAFSYFTPYNASSDMENKEQVILFLSDGSSTGVKDPIAVIRDENRRFGNKVIIFTFLLGIDPNAKSQMQGMAEQSLYDTSVGPIWKGQYHDFNTNKDLLAADIAVFYTYLPTGNTDVSSTFTVPFVDPFSEIGLITSLCVAVNDIYGLHGIACTDVKLGELLSQLEYFSEEEYSYAFIIDGTGRALMHPLLPDVTFVKSDEEPVLVDISVLEREHQAQNVIDSMKSAGSGNASFDKYFTKPRGQLIHDGSTHVLKNANYFWGPVPQSNFSLCVVLVDQSYEEIDEYRLSVTAEDLANVFMYHDRSLLSDDFKDCKSYKRRVTYDRSCIKFSPAAFENPFQYLDHDETAEDVLRYKRYLTKQTTTTTDFKRTLRPSVIATYEAEKYWKRNPARFVAWRYIATKSGFIRVYPGVLLKKSYDHLKRIWWRQVLAHEDMMFVTPPYVDAWGSGIVISMQHTIHKQGSTHVTAVAGADFPLEYLVWYISNLYPSCDQSDYRCIIVDDTGFIVMHPRLKETREESEFIAPDHITVEEPGIARKMRNNGVLTKHECQDYSVNTNLRSYRITMPSGKSTGLSFVDTGGYFEIRPIKDSNLFIIREKAQSPNPSCICDGSKSPDILTCVDSSNHALDCDCLCHTDIVYDVCSNEYNTRDAGLPCSARLPDTSGVSKPDVLDGLDTCYVVSCHNKQTKLDCFSEAECSWCEYTDIGELISTPCCRLKEECTFGRTKSASRDTCAPVTTPKPTRDNSSVNTDQTGAAVGGALAAGIIMTLIVMGGIYLWRKRNKHGDDVDPYIDPVPDQTNSMNLEQFSEQDEFRNIKNPTVSYLKSLGYENYYTKT